MKTFEKTMNIFIGCFVIFGVLYIMWYFAIYLPSADHCNNQKGMAVHSVRPWGVKCTTYDEAFDYWNHITPEEKAQNYETMMWLDTDYAERQGCKWVTDGKNPFPVFAEFWGFYSKRGYLFCPKGVITRADSVD